MKNNIKNGYYEKLKIFHFIFITKSTVVISFPSTKLLKTNFWDNGRGEEAFNRGSVMWISQRFGIPPTQNSDCIVEYYDMANML